MSAQDSQNIVVGRHGVKSAIAKQKVARLLILSGTNKDLVVFANQAKIQIEFVSKSFLAKTAGTDKNQGTMAFIKLSKKSTWKDKLENNPNSIFLILDEIEDPHNLGACIRSAVAFGVSAIIIPKRNSAKLSPVVSKVASGADLHILVQEVANIVREIQAMQKLGVTIYGTDANAKESIFNIKERNAMALILGNEAKGMRRLTKENCDHLVSIPLENPQQVASLNVAVACGICLACIVNARK